MRFEGIHVYNELYSQVTGRILIGYLAPSDPKYIASYQHRW